MPDVKHLSALGSHYFPFGLFFHRFFALAPYPGHGLLSILHGFGLFFGGKYQQFLGKGKGQSLGRGIQELLLSLSASYPTFSFKGKGREPIVLFPDFTPCPFDSLLFALLLKRRTP